ncbi:MAG: hypothetical protein EKK46_14510 [Rhodocyclaceae bacterium]|nr:MAG: hypothetical protein EKK46_14510 [Rhodocyclaceae bacterium]
MQIDFHHAVTYAIARLSGFDHPDADVVAYASQYVDDSTTSGFLRFNNGMRFSRQATAHPMLNAKNLDNDENSLSWLPFHFLPGNEGAVAGTVIEDYSRKLICRPDSPIARAMMADVINVKDRPHALHRLGIASHVFVDTFAHQGFVGQLHELNNATDVKDSNGDAIPVIKVPPIGHGQVGTCPDQPYLSWSYKDSNDKEMSRDNLGIFMQAADRLCQEFRRYLLGSLEADVPNLPDEDRGRIHDLLFCTRNDNGEERHQVWIQAIDDGYFSFGPTHLHYAGKGTGSWKHQALGDDYLKWLEVAENIAADTTKHPKNLIGRVGAVIHSVASHAEAMAEHIGVEPVYYPYSQEFHNSNYKLFHDAARDQRQAIFGSILPAHGIYAA